MGLYERSYMRSGGDAGAGSKAESHNENQKKCDILFHNRFSFVL